MNKNRAYILAIFTTLLALVSNVYFVTALGLGLFVYTLADFLEKIGEGLPILEAMLFIACLQWIVGPYIDYVTEYRHYKYHMYVPEEAYMDLVVPSLFLLALPVYYTSNKIDYAFFLQRIQQLKITDRFAINLILIGFLSDIMTKLAPASIAFVFFLRLYFYLLLCDVYFFSFYYGWYLYSFLLLAFISYPSHGN